MENKRNYFRVKTTIAMRVVDTGRSSTTIPAEKHFADSETTYVKRQILSFRQEVNQQLRAIPSANDTIYVALQNLQKQMDLLSSFVLKDESDSQQHDVTLSEGGIGWIQKMPIALEQRIALQLDLDPLTTLYFIGEVVTCIPLNNTYRIGVRFENVAEHERQEIAKYVLKVNAEQLRLRRNTI